MGLAFAEGSGALNVELTLYYCEAVNESLCFVDRVRLNLPVVVDAQAGGGSLSLVHDVIPPAVE
jgi:hypothetical protein